MKYVILSGIMMVLGLPVFGQGNTISGYVKDASNGEALIGATVVVKGSSQGSITNVYGFYSLTLPSDSYTIEFRYIGYNTMVQTIDLTSNQRVDIELAIQSQQLEEIVVSAEAEDINVSGIQMGTTQLDMKTISKIPTLLGEADVLKGLQMLPGVATVGEGASGFNVRGGSVGQNMVLMDEAPVYNSSHLLGFFSVFNPDAVKDVTLIKGGIPARYGGRISSVLDIRMKEGNTKKFAGQGGIGTVFSRLAVEGPLIKDKASFIIAARRSYADVFAKAFTNVLADGAALNFYDLTMKANYNINAKNRVYLSGYFGRDNFKFDAQQGFNWGNSTGTLRWNKIFNYRLFSNFTALFSDYNYKLAFGETADDQFDWNSRVFNYDFKSEFNYYINPRNELSFGGELLFYRFEPANAVGVSKGKEVVIKLPEKRALESSIYISNDQKIGTKIELRYGLRYSNFQLFGPGEAQMFGDTVPGKRKPYLGGTDVPSGKTIANYGNLEPRLSAKYQLSKKTSVKASYNRTAQYIHLISNTVASNPLDVWTASSNNIKPQIGDQVALGLFQNYGNKNDYEASAEVYYRRTQNQIDYIDGADLLINEHLEGDLLSGNGRAYGLELFVKKNTGALTGWVSYTMARTELQVVGINNNNWYPTRYDQPHNLKVAGFYETGGRWSFSANFTFMSGTPTTFPSDRYYVGPYLAPYISDNARNNLRIPSYHRLDLSATLQGKNKNKKFESYWIFSIYNAYGRRNPFSIYFKQNSEVRPMNGSPIDTQAQQVSIIGSIVPAFSYNIKF